MFRLPRKAMHALLAVVDIALNARPDPVQSKDIGRRQQIPPRYLEHCMQQLVRAGLLKGTRGPKGGYTLARERRRITVGDVVRVVAAEERGDDGPESRHSALASGVVGPVWDEIETIINARLDAVTVEELCRRAGDRGLTETPIAATDFTI